MKTLSLLRHAKSDWGDPATRDFDRPLNARGAHAARAIGRELRALGLGFDLVLASPARRVVETLEGVAAGYGRALEPVYDPDLYLAPPPLMRDIVGRADDGRSRLLVVGHNPGCALLAAALSGHGAPGLRHRLAARYPTGAFAEIALPVAHWRDAAEGAGTLTRFIRPRDLETAGE
jgi:phosphohistidine phosphatase